MPRLSFATIKALKCLVSIVPLLIASISICQVQPPLLLLQRSKLAHAVRNNLLRTQKLATLLPRDKSRIPWGP